MLKWFYSSEFLRGSFLPYCKSQQISRVSLDDLFMAYLCSSKRKELYITFFYLVQEQFKKNIFGKTFNKIFNELSF